MSIVNRNGERTEPVGADHPLRCAAQQYAGRDAFRQRIAGVRLLREGFGWTYQEIARFMRSSTGNVSRLDKRGQVECPGFFQPPPDAAAGSRDA